MEIGLLMDRRDYASADRWWDRIDESRMLAHVRGWAKIMLGEWMPFEYETCHMCSGRGTYVNPAIDSEGISMEQFDEDPEFRESYFSGVYDIRCQTCDGQRVIPVPTRAEDADAIEDWQREQWGYAAEVEAERRSGA